MGDRGRRRRCQGSWGVPPLNLPHILAPPPHNKRVVRSSIDNSGKHEGHDAIPPAHAPVAQRLAATAINAADAEQRWLPLSSGEAGKRRTAAGDARITGIAVFAAADTAAAAKQRVIIVLKARFGAVHVR